MNLIEHETKKHRLNTRMSTIDF